MHLLQKIKVWLNPQSVKPVAILSVDYREYKYAETLEAQGQYRVLFFIGENPWNYRNKMGNGVIRSLSDLEVLCQKHNIREVFYFDDNWIAKAEPFNLPLVAACDTPQG